MNTLLLQAEIPLVWEVLANQILPIMLLAVAVYWFNKQSRLKDEKIDKLYKIIMDDSKEDRERLMQVIEKSTEATQAVAKILEQVIILQNQK